MVTKTEAIKSFLVAYAPQDLSQLYNHDMEVQVTVAKDFGTRIEGDFKGRQWNGYTDGFQIWKPIRIPLNAMSEPEFEDSPMSYDLSIHADGIGMTGWDWRNRLSRWVAFDFDAISGHSDKHAKKLTESELDKIRNLVSEIPWVTVRRSTGGKGLHIYVFVEPTHTNNHTEHAAVARAVLSQLSGIAGFEFSTKVDVSGGNMWVWHRKMKGTEGLVILKSGTQFASVPANWKDYVAVVSGRRQRNLPWFIDEQSNKKDDIEDVFAELTGQRLRTALDSEHRKIMEWHREHYPNAAWWDAEHHMLVTHTSILKECHEALNLRGKFETNAKGSERGYDINCFAFPLSRGGWTIRRYSLGAEEHPFWEQDGHGWTKCNFNREPDLGSACRIYGGLEETSGGYVFATADEAQKAALLLGANLDFPPWAMSARCKLKPHKSGRLIVELNKDSNSPQLQGWIAEGKKFTRMFPIKSAPVGEPEILRLDDQVRKLITETGEDAGWVVRSEGCWHTEPYQNVKVFLSSLGYKPNDVLTIMGSSVGQCWKLVNKPFEKEYTSNREWNRNAAQIRHTPTVNRDGLKYPTWMKLLNHCGNGLNDSVMKNEWCKINGILTGADYLKCWIAALFQMPREPLPYLFFYGEQNNGKSSFHEALSLLISNGVVRADHALTSQSNFNGELLNAVICIVEETDLRKNNVAYNRIKDWVTSRMLPIHVKGRTPYSVPNTTHWIQAANSHLYCPVFPGDTRITMSLVPKLEELIPKRELIVLLDQEGPDFIAEILGLEIPQSNDRLSLPVLMTEDKQAAEYANQSMLEMFLTEKTYPAQGHWVKFSELYNLFTEWLDPNEVAKWSKIRVGKEIPPKFPKGRRKDDGQFFVGNLSLTMVEEKDFKAKFILHEGVLVQ